MSLFDNVNTQHRALDYHLRRQNVLASNVANIDTPGFRPRELVRDTGESLDPGALRLQRTEQAHFQLPGAKPAGEEGVGVERVVQPGGDENSVSLEREMAKVSANDLRYQTVSRLVRQHLGLLRYAATDGTNG